MSNQVPKAPRKQKFKIIELAVHWVGKPQTNVEYAKAAQNVGSLDARVTDYFEDRIEEIWQHPETSKVFSGRYPDVPKGKKPLVQNNIEGIRSGTASFFDSTVKLARHLYQNSHGNASPGLFAIILFESLIKRKPGKFVALLKIHKRDDTHLVKLDEEALTRLSISDIKNVLLEETQKGAIYPHPSKVGFSFKIIDKQGDPNTPSKYFIDNFLECSTKKNDEHQIKRLLPELRNYGSKRKLPLANEKLPDVIGNLKKGKKDITTPYLTRVVKELEVFGPDFDPDDFNEFVENESTLGKVDIPSDSFDKRASRFRYLKVTVTQPPQYSGIEIRGPEWIIRDLISVEGDSISFYIETTVDGFTFDYD